MTISKSLVERLDAEKEAFRNEMMPRVLRRECTLEDIFGFKFSETKARAYLKSRTVSLRAALVLYDETLIAIPEILSKEEKFVDEYHFTPQEIAF